MKPVTLPNGWGTASIKRRQGRASRSRWPRSYDSTGLVLTWMPDAAMADAAVACDIEHVSRFDDETCRLLCVSPDLGIERWTVTEVLAKLGGLPILQLLHAQGLARVPGHYPARFDLPSREPTAHAHIYSRWHPDSGHFMSFGYVRPGNRDQEAG